MLGSPTITVKGRNLLAKIVAANIPLTLSNIGLGDGLQEENEEVASLVNEIMKKEIEACTYNEKEGQYYIRRVFTNAELEEGFYIREVGIYAIDPDEGEILYAYTNAGETGVDYFAPGKGKVIVKEIIEMATKFGNAENITVIIDTSAALVTEQEFEEYKEINKTNIDNLQKQVTKNTKNLEEKSNKGHTHAKTDITDFPSTMKNPNALNISLNGTSQGSYDGSTVKNINITPKNIGAATDSKDSFPTFGAIELITGTPFIDFHFGKSEEDYTSRIIEQSKGHLDILTPNGVAFSANISAPNHIYEEGLWTPSAFGSAGTNNVTYHSRYGWFKRFNNLVFFAGYVQLNTFDFTGYVHIGGIPFAPLNVRSHCSVNIRDYANYTNDPLFGEVIDSCVVNILSGKNMGISGNQLESGSQIIVSGFYAIG